MSDHHHHTACAAHDNAPRLCQWVQVCWSLLDCSATTSCPIQSVSQSVSQVLTWSQLPVTVNAPLLPHVAVTLPEYPGLQAMVCACKRTGARMSTCVSDKIREKAGSYENHMRQTAFSSLARHTATHSHTCHPQMEKLASNKTCVGTHVGVKHIQAESSGLPEGERCWCW
jgi:hypothetical protein